MKVTRTRQQRYFRRRLETSMKSASESAHATPRVHRRSIPTMSAVAFGAANRVALKSGVRARPAARCTAVAVHAAHDSNGDKIRARLASASLATALVLAPVAVAPMPAFAEGCQSSCEAEC